MVAFTLFSCKSIQQLKNTNALNRVKGNVNLLNDAGEEYIKLHPLKIDTTTVWVYGGRPDVVHDTTYTVDTLINDSIRTKIVYREVLKVRVDTARVIIDHTSELQAANSKISNQEGQITQLDKSNSAFQKDTKRLHWTIVGVSIFSLLAIIGLCILLFKSKPIKL